MTTFIPPKVGSVGVSGTVIHCHEIVGGRAGKPLYFVRMRADAAMFGFEPAPDPGTPSALVFSCMTNQSVYTGAQITFDVVAGNFGRGARNVQLADSVEARLAVIARLAKHHDDPALAEWVDALASRYQKMLVAVGEL